MKKETTKALLAALPEEVLNLCPLDLEKPMKATLSPGFLVIHNQKMRAMEVVSAITALTQLRGDLMAKLSEHCGICDHCDYCEGILSDEDEIKLPQYVLDEAGIPLDAKLTFDTDEDSGEILVYEADYDYDLSDVPSELIEELQENGICIGELDEALRMEYVIDVK